MSSFATPAKQYEIPIRKKSATSQSVVGGRYRLATKSIYNHICPNWVVLDSEAIILYQFQSSSLPQVQLLLCEEVFETLMIYKNITRFFIKIMPPNLECKDHGCKLEIMGRIVPITRFQFPRSISNNISILHKYTPKPN
jgi:hypothetical protein